MLDEEGPSWLSASPDKVSAETGFGLPPRSTFDRSGAGGQNIHITDYVRVLYKRRWTAITVVAIVMLLFTGYALTVTPIYEATARLIIETDKQNVLSFKQVVEDENQPTDTYFQTQYKLLESRTLSAKTLDALGLWNAREFHVPASASAYETLVSALGGGSGRSRSQDGPPAGAETLEQSRVLDLYSRRLTVSPVRNSRLVDVRFQANSADLAARVANAHATAFIDRNMENKFLTSKEATDWLGERLAEQRKKVEESESAVQRYREQKDAVALEERENIVVQKLADINAAVTKAKTERIEKEALYRQLESIGRDTNALDTFPAIISNSFIQQAKTQLADLQRQRAQLSKTLGDLHPDMIKLTTAIQVADAKLQSEITKVVQSVQNAYLAAEAQERKLVQALDAQKAEALAMNRKGIEGAVLKRDADSNRVLYEGLLQRAKETSVSGELKSRNIRLVDPAEIPSLPINPSPKKPLGFLAAFAVGVALASCLVFFFEYMDDRLKTPEEISAHLGLPTLGLVPQVPKMLGSHALISNGVPLNFAEAFRTVRTAVLFSSTETGGTRVVVTSTQPGEGKTITACNLAAGIAQTGMRVLVVDADMRLPTLHTAFGVDIEPGLSNLLVGNALSKDAIRLSSVANLWVLPSGHIPPNPAELLASRQFQDLLKLSSEHFDWIVIDAPPVLAVTDATIVAHLTHGVVFVVGADMTSRRAAATALERIEQSNGRFFGAVMNRVNIKRHPYYYSRYYHKKYASYYTAPANQLT